MSNNIQNIKLESIEKRLNVVSLLLAIAFAALGVLLCIYSGNMESSMLSSTIIFIGVVAIIVALFLLFAKLKKDIYVKTGSPVSKKNIFYDTADFFGIKNALESGNFQAIKRIKTIEDGNVQIYALFSKDRKFAAVQLLKYEPFDFIPQTNIIIMEDDKAEDLINAIA